MPAPETTTISGPSHAQEQWQESLAAELSDGSVSLPSPDHRTSDTGDESGAGEFAGCEAEALAALRSAVAPEASEQWCSAYEVYSLYEKDLWPQQQPQQGRPHPQQEESLFNSLHLGKTAPAAVFALNHFLVTSERLQPPRLKWRWSAASENPHFEAREDHTEWPEVNNMLYCFYPERWFHAEDGSGCLLAHQDWRGPQLWRWLRGPSTCPSDLARRLPRLVTASPLPCLGRTGEAGGLLATLVVAIGALQMGGCLCVTLVDAFGTNETEAFLGLLSLLFERVDALPNGSVGSKLGVCVVALCFRGVRGVLLQALVRAVRRTLAGKQQRVLPSTWAERVLGGSQLLERLGKWFAVLSAAAAQGESSSQRVQRLNLRRIPGQRHLLWACSPGVAVRPLKRGSSRPLGATASQEAESPGESMVVRWFAMDPGKLAHRSLLRTMDSCEAVLQTAQSLWWRSFRDPGRLLQSPFATQARLAELARLRDRAPTRCLQRQEEQLGLPPLQVAAWAQLVRQCLPERVSQDQSSLTYASLLRLHTGASHEARSETWLSEQMHLRVETRDLTCETAVVEAGFDAVLVDFVSQAAALPATVAWHEMDAASRRSFVALLLGGLRALSVGGDLFLRLPSLYTRLFAGAAALLAVSFDRIAGALPEFAPAVGERWLVCCSFRAAGNRGLVSQRLLSAFHARLCATASGSYIPDILPPSCTCSSSFGLRQFLRELNDKAMEAELHWRREPAGQPARAGDDERSQLLKRLAQLDLKRLLYPGQQHRVLVGVYFGSFDPFHENHYRVVLCALRQCGVARVVLVPNAAGNPYKPLCNSLDERVLCIRQRVDEALSCGELEPGQVVVRAAGAATNWPQREELASVIEGEEFADEPLVPEVVLLLGEDSLMKSLDCAAGKHKSSGIFQLKTRPRRLLVFPRAGAGEGDILARVPERLRPLVRVAEHQDLVQGLSSSSLRDLLKSGADTPPPAVSLHPRVWERLSQGHRQKPPESSPAIVGGSDAEETPTSRKRPVNAEETRSHYDAKLPKTLQSRQESSTVRLRNCNSFAKAVLLEQLVVQLRAEIGDAQAAIAVLDLGCGQGGDLKKLANCGVTNYCGVDFSEASLRRLLARADSLAKVGRARHGLLGETGLRLKELSLLHADCWHRRIAHELDTLAGYGHGTARSEDLGQAWFHLTSSQMACHYAFESEEAADTMLRNASERLCPGGLFVSTLPDAGQIIAGVQEAWERSGQPMLGNELYNIEFEPGDWARVQESMQAWTHTASAADWGHAGATAGQSGVFGLMYRFSLVDAVDRCAEPLVHPGMLLNLARRHGLELQMGPLPLVDLMRRALAEGAAKAELGRLCRIYHYHGGMSYDESAPEWAALRLYSAYVFRKCGGGDKALSCSQLSQSLGRLNSRQGPGLQLLGP